MKTIFFLVLFTACFSGAQAQEAVLAKESPAPDEKSVYTIVDEQAEYPGGMGAMYKFIASNIVFPQRCKEDSLFSSCKVYLKFIVNEDGAVSDISVLKGCNRCPEADQEAMRVAGILPRWKPARQQGKPVKVYFNIPVQFKIQ